MTDQTIDANTDAVNWTMDFQRGGNGQIISNLANVYHVLEHDDRFKNIHRYNEMLHQCLVQNGEGPLYLVDDKYYVHVQKYMQKYYGLKTIGIENVKNAIKLHCSELPYHPVRKYLSRLEWDGIPRIEEWTEHYLGAASSLYNHKVGCMFLISMVARIMEPGCKCDHMLVLEGEQGIGKSTACQILFGEYFSDYLPDIGSKDASDHVTRFWGIEIAEMHTYNRSETAGMKSFLSRTEEHYRPAYGYEEVIRRRQCVFIGTTNQELYLKDETGGRRFWPVKCGKIDLNLLKDDRDQLLAEAVYRYAYGWAWYPDRDFENIYIKPEQEKRREFDDWQNLIITNIQSLAPNFDKVTIDEIWRGPLRMPLDRPCSNPDQRRIGKILTTLGCRPTRTKYRMMYDVSHLAKKIRPTT